MSSADHDRQAARARLSPAAAAVPSSAARQMLRTIPPKIGPWKGTSTRQYRWPKRPLGLNVPIYPIKGYSITVPIEDAARAPESTP